MEFSQGPIENDLEILVDQLQIIKKCINKRMFVVTWSMLIVRLKLIM